MLNKTKIREIKVVNKYKLFTSHHYIHAIMQYSFIQYTYVKIMVNEQNNIILVLPTIFTNSKGSNLVKFYEIVCLVLLFSKAFDYFKNLLFINERGSDRL